MFGQIVGTEHPRKNCSLDLIQSWAALPAHPGTRVALIDSMVQLVATAGSYCYVSILLDMGVSADFRHPHMLGSLRCPCLHRKERERERADWLSELQPPGLRIRLTHCWTASLQALKAHTGVHEFC